MRSSKSRSRNKNNRNNHNRSAVNIVNRVFDSSGPEGKVRGTPQQIIDKYNQLARDAQLSNDRVAAENFQQHAEHYLRMLSEAQREIDARREQDAQRDRQNQQNNNNNQNNGQNNGQNSGHNNNNNNNNQNSGQNTAQNAPQPEPVVQPELPASEAAPKQPEAEQPRPRRARAPRSDKKPSPAASNNDVIDTPEASTDGDSGLVETPESKPAKPRRSRAKPKPKPKADTENAGADAEGGNPDTPEAAE